jgi:hypothetical protein
MAEFQFDPPLRLKGGRLSPKEDVIVLTLDDAAAFMRWLKHPKLIRTRDSVLRLVERAGDEQKQRIAADMFRLWAESEGILLSVR